MNYPEYMRELVSQGEDITIVGVVQPREDAIATILDAGIGYPAALTQHVIEEAAASSIVQEQLAGPNINVLTGDAFGADDGQGGFSPLKNAPLPADKAVHPLWKSMDAGRGIFHSDIRLRYNLWHRLDSGIELILSGASAEEATESVIQALHDAQQGKEGKQGKQS